MEVRGLGGEADSPSCILRAERVVWALGLFHLSCPFSVYCSVHKQSPPAAGMHSAESHLSASSWHDIPSESRPLPPVCTEGRAQVRLLLAVHGMVSAQQPVSAPSAGAHCPRSQGQTRYLCLGFPSQPGSCKCVCWGFKGCCCSSGRVSSPVHNCYLKIIFLMLILHFEKSLSQLPFSCRYRDLRSACQFWEKQNKTGKTAVDNWVEFIYWYSCRHISPLLIFTFLFCFFSIS